MNPVGLQNERGEKITPACEMRKKRRHRSAALLSNEGHKVFFAAHVNVLDYVAVGRIAIGGKEMLKSGQSLDIKLVTQLKKKKLIA